MFPSTLQGGPGAPVDDSLAPAKGTRVRRAPAKERDILASQQVHSILCERKRERNFHLRKIYLLDCAHNLANLYMGTRHARVYTPSKRSPQPLLLR
jgi:hypothetical protein